MAWNSESEASPEFKILYHKPCRSTLGSYGEIYTPIWKILMDPGRTGIGMTLFTAHGRSSAVAARKSGFAKKS